MIDQREIAPKVPYRIPSKSGCEERIADASFPEPFLKGLLYAPPARGSWTIAHSPMLIPGLHEIYVCCACCLHGVVLSADEIPEGGNERFSMVTLTNENILKGDLEEMMIDGVSRIVEELPQRPRLVECFTSCVQHFLHIDLKLVYRRLRERFTDIDFLDGYMIPTLARRLSPDMLGRRQLLRAASARRKERIQTGKTDARDRAVSLVVNYYPMDPHAEFVQMFRQAGYEVRDFGALKSYEDYLALADAEAAVYHLPASGPAAEDFARKTGMASYFLPYSYSYEELRASYEALAERFGLSVPDTETLEKECRKKASALSKKLSDTAIVLDYTASPRVLSLARFLLHHGFRVRAVYADAFGAQEEEDFRILQKHHPDLLLRATQHYKMRLLPRDEGKKEKLLAIGQKAAYFAGTDYFVNMIENGAADEAGQMRQLHGFSGILRLLSLMEEAAKAPKDVRSIIEVKAYGCSGGFPEKGGSASR